MAFSLPPTRPADCARAILLLGLAAFGMGPAPDLAAGQLPAPPVAPCSAGQLYLTLDTGSMQVAEKIARALREEHVVATFFVANEATWRGDHALDPAWAGYWRDRVAEGHVFGSHTWSHASVRRDLPDGGVRATAMDGQPVEFDEAGYCAELTRTSQRFRELTGQPLSGLWRAPGGHTTARTLQWAARCGFPRHVGWSDAGFLGDELPSERYPNELLLKRALDHVHAGDILMMHLGIRSRHTPFAEVFQPLLAGLKAKGYCFATLPPPKS